VTPDEERIAFYYELGLAISAWAGVEMKLCEMCYAFVKDRRESSALFFGFFGIENFRSKVEFAQRLLTAAYHGDANAQRIPRVFEKLKQSSAKRNKLVHRRTWYYVLGKPGRRYVLEDWPKGFEPPPRNAKAGDIVKPPSNAFGVREIIAIRLEFLALHAALERLNASLLRVPTPLPESAELPKHPPGIQSLARQIREALGRRPRSSRRRS
jgi:hypothetical protein